MIYLNIAFLYSGLSFAQYLGVSFSLLLIDGANGGHPGQSESRNPKKTHAGRLVSQFRTKHE